MPVTMARLGSGATAVLCAGALALGAASPAAVADAQPDPAVRSVEVPLDVADIAGPRLVAEVSIGGVPLRVLLDTGSTGLRVVADKVPRTAVSVQGDAPPYGYGSGTRLHGKVARTDLRIGGHLAADVPIQLVTSTTCAASKPNCPASGGRKPLMFGRFLDGVLGVSTADAPALANPLWSLRDASGRAIGRQFAVHYAPGGHSRLLLDVPPTGYRTVQLPDRGDADDPAGPPSWNPRALHACFTSTELPSGPVCGPTLLDTGATAFRILTQERDTGPLPDGTDIELGVPAARWSRTFTVGQDTRARTEDAPPSTRHSSSAGLAAYVGTHVRYDLTHGTIGFAPFPPIHPLIKPRL